MTEVWTSYRRFLRLKKRSDITIKSYSWSYEALKKHAGQDPVLLTQDQIEAFVDYRLETVSCTTVRKNVIDLKIFYRWAVKEGFISANPMARIPTPDEAQTLPTVFTDDELRALFKVCSGKDFYSQRDLAILRLLSEIGSPRLGELINMKIKDVDLDSDLITLCGKTGERKIPVGLKTGRALEIYLRARGGSPEDALWLGKMGPLGRNGIAQLLKRRGAQAGIKGSVHPHLFRHTASSRASESGLSDSLLEPLMGWIPGSKMTRVYARSTRVRRAQDAARKLSIGDKL